MGSERTDSPREVVNDASSELSLRAERRLPGDQAALATGPPDIGAALEVEDRVVVPWVREISTADWLVDLASHSSVPALSNDERALLLEELRAIVDEEFTDGGIAIRYETWLWIGNAI
jgi:hypothetical protein